MINLFHATHETSRLTILGLLSYFILWFPRSIVEAFPAVIDRQMPLWLP